MYNNLKRIFLLSEHLISSCQNAFLNCLFLLFPSRLEHALKHFHTAGGLLGALEVKPDYWMSMENVASPHREEDENKKQKCSDGRKKEKKKSWSRDSGKNYLRKKERKMLSWILKVIVSHCNHKGLFFIRTEKLAFTTAVLPLQRCLLRKWNSSQMTT